jgi:hypothetical protein
VLLESGFQVIVDAAFLSYAQRQPFRLLAEQLAVPVVILSIQAGEDLLRQRIRLRQQHSQDASEADLVVLDKAMARVEAIQTDEAPATLVYHNEADRVNVDDRQTVWRELERILS